MQAPKEPTFPIPSRLNTVLTLVALVSSIALLIIGARMPLGWALAPVALAFGLIMVPVYSLIHEAEHSLLHENRRVNYLLGNLLSILFMAPFTFFQQCHIGHHKRNRTDYEMFDLHYEHQSRTLRSISLTAFRLGAQFLLLPFSTLLFLIFPRIVTSPVFRLDLVAEGMLSGLYKEALPKIRLESLAVVGFHGLLFVLFDLAWQNYLIIYLVHGFIWSSQNYVNHAHSVRDVIHGAHNHRLPKWIQAFYLNFNLHLAHHEHPKVPWLYLDQFVDRDDPNRPSFFGHYLKLWRGTKLTHEPSPVPLDEIRNRKSYQKSVPLLKKDA
jgi:fatty acid desaturase